MPAQLITHRQDAVLTLTISAPEMRNALSPEVYAAGIEALNAADSDGALRAVILRGEGGHFCAGGDLNRLAANRELPPSHQDESIRALHDFIQALRDFPKPVIAAVEGHAAGAGFSLVLACDLVVAAADARFALSYGRVGLTPDGGASWHLAQAVPRALALEWLWLADGIGAERLHALGLVNRLCGAGEAHATAQALAAQLAQMAPNAVAAAKALMQRAPQASLREQLDAERAEFIASLFHDNVGEGIAAFRARRAPRFGPA